MTFLYLLPPSLKSHGFGCIWAHEICSGDNEERAIVVVSMNEIAYVVQAWLPLLVRQQVDAPQYRKGYIASSVLFFLLIPTALYLRCLHYRERRRATEHMAWSRSVLYSKHRVLQLSCIGKWLCFPQNPKQCAALHYHHRNVNATLW